MALKPNALQVLSADEGGITHAVFNDILGLMEELHGGPLSSPLRATQVIKTVKFNTVVVMTDENARIIGMATLIVWHKLFKIVGRIEDVIVTKSFRGRGKGREIMEHVHALARKQEVVILELTSNSSREKAHSLYKSLGYQIRDTNVFRLEL